MPDNRVASIEYQLNEAIDNRACKPVDYYELTIRAILAVGAEINFLRIALNTSTTGLEECINRIVDESVKIVLSGKP